MQSRPRYASFFFFNDTATTEIYTLSYTTLFRSHQDAIHLVGLHAAIFENQERILGVQFPRRSDRGLQQSHASDRKSTRLNSSHSQISYAVFCLKQKNLITHTATQTTHD